MVSDNINVKGFKTSAGTKSLKNYKPSEDAEIIKRLREEGGMVIGIILADISCFIERSNLASLWYFSCYDIILVMST